MKIDVNKVKIGSDFELFIVDGENFISALPFIEGTKESPSPVTPLGHAIQADGVLFEANVPPVSINNGEEMWANIELVIAAGQERLPENLTIKCCPNGEFAEDQLEDPRARESGCTPDFCAWTNGGINEKPELNDTPKRCCGFHIHVSFPGASVKNVMRLIRIMDVNLALTMLFVDEDRERRKLYGKAGCFRFKDYGGVGGVEYRTLSNTALKDKETFDFVWNQLTKSIHDYNEGADYLEYGDIIQSAINNYDLEQAKELCEVLEVNTLV